ncbi:CRIB domain-containing protein RIC6-like protein [Cinnamomum micranthum f. kanehirae]|uniref:CRIB domain-containing protein RIC6-like protein n=1 Tax=Cinnamomum micranthum f. kanehirae TaxID=337451 RepID=A0A3S3N219_9MAGN|nr:CRIB domain-containing protein RIC6-like protein [Cinnamomum micranthum f. kanehirae]
MVRGENLIGFSEVKASETAPSDGIPNPGDSEGHRRRNSMDALLAKQVIPLQMTTKVKGLLKGLRYISQIFEPGKEQEQEQEMQIGHPTDVKHVAHIGWDGPSGPSTTTTPPTCVNENKPTTQDSSTKPLSTPEEIKEQQGSPTKKTSHGRRNSNGDPEHPKSSRRHQTQDSANNEQSDAPKALRRRSQKPSSRLDSSTKESSIDAPNHARRKKSNRPTDGGSTRPSRSRVQAAANSNSEAKNAEEQPPPSKPKEEEEIQSV